MSLINEYMIFVCRGMYGRDIRRTEVGANVSRSYSSYTMSSKSVWWVTIILLFLLLLLLLLFIYCAFPRVAQSAYNEKNHTQNKNENLHIPKNLDYKKNVLSPCLNEETDGDCLSIKDSLFQYLDAVIVKVRSPASFRVMLYVRRSGSLEARRFLLGVYRVKQSRRYWGFINYK